MTETGASLLEAARESDRSLDEVWDSLVELGEEVDLSPDDDGEDDSAEPLEWGSNTPK